MKLEAIDGKRNRVDQRLPYLGYCFDSTSCRVFIIGLFLGRLFTASRVTCQAGAGVFSGSVSNRVLPATRTLCTLSLAGKVLYAQYLVAGRLLLFSGGLSFDGGGGGLRLVLS